MALKGNTGSIDLANVFQMLTLSEKVGTLVIYAGGVRTSLYFDGSGVFLPYHPDSFSEKVRALCLRSGWLTDDDVAAADQHTLPLFEALKELERMTEEDAAAAFRLQMEEEIYDLFFAKDASFEFMEGRSPLREGSEFDPRYRLNAGALVMEAARRVDEWAHFQEKVPSENCVFEVAADLEVLSDEALEGAEEVFNTLDGHLPVCEVIERTRMPRFQVFKKLVQFLDSRIIYELAEEDLLDRASKCLENQEHASGLAILHRVLELGSDDAMVHEMAAMACQTLKRLGQACHHLSLVAESKEKTGGHAEAAEIYLKIRDLMPTDVHARQSLVRLHRRDSDLFENTDFDLIQEASELAAILHAIGREDEVGETLLLVHEEFVDNFKVSAQLSQIAVDLSCPRVALTMLMATGEQFLDQGEHSQALRLFRRVRSLDSNHTDIDDRIRECLDAVEKTKPQTRPFLKVAILILVLGGAGAWYYGYHRNASKAFMALGTEKLALAGDFDGALRLLADFQQTYPGTLAAGLAKGEAESLASRGSKHRLRMDQIETGEREEIQKRQEQAERLATEARKELQAGSYPAALELLQRTTALTSDSAWLRKKGITQLVEEVSHYLNRADALAAAMKKGREEKRWRDVHTAGMELLGDYSRSPWAAEVKLPVVIDSIPSKSTFTLQVPGRSARALKTPVVLELRLSERPKVVIEREGYFPAEFVVHPDKSAEHLVRLDRQASLRFNLQPPALFAPLITDTRVFASCDNGRVTALNIKTGEVVWQVTLPRLQEVKASPVLFKDQVVVLGSAALEVFDRVSGKHQQSIELKSSPVREPQIVRGVILVGEGRTDSEEGEILRAYTLSDGVRRWEREVGPLSAGPIAVPDGFLYATSEARMVRLDGRNGDITKQWNLPTPATAISVADGGILAGSKDRKVRLIPFEDGGRAWGLKLPEGPAVDDLRLEGATCLVVAGTDLYRLSIANGEIVGSATGSVYGPFACTGGDRVVVAGSANRLLEFRGKPVEMGESYRLEEPVVFAAAAPGVAVFFSASGGVHVIHASR